MPEESDKKPRVVHIDRLPAAKLGAVDGGVPEVIVYKDGGFQGDSWRTNLAYSYVGDDWNDSISSFIVVQGLWIFYKGADFVDGSRAFGPGYYPTMDPGWNDVISSFGPIT